MPERKRRASTRIALWCALVLSLPIVTSMALPGTSGAAPTHRADAWIKLCGAANTCLNAPWHPWLGDNVYKDGQAQTVSAGVEEGNMIRFWVLLQNDETISDTLRVKGCPGTSTFPLLSANVGAWRYHTNLATITSAFKAGTASFTFPAAPATNNVIITLTFRALTTKRGVGYSCPVTVSSATQPTLKDTVTAKMTTI
jgi:hypothetical protein